MEAPKLRRRERRNSYRSAAILGGGLIVGLPLAGLIVGAFYGSGGLLGLLGGCGVAVGLLAILAAMWCDALD